MSIKTSKICKVCEFDLLINEFRPTGKNAYCSWCRDCERKKSLERYHANRQQCMEKNKQYKIDNADVLKEKRQEYLEKNKDYVKARYKLYCANNREKLNRIARDYLKNNLNAKLRAIFSKRLYGKIKKNKSTSDYMDSSVQLIRKWIEFNFDDNMNWDNYGDVWQLDHTLPINLFNLEIDEEIYICFNWKNLMPLSKHCNMVKSDKIIPIRIFYQEKQLRNFANFYEEEKNNIYDYIQLYTNSFKKMVNKL